MGQEHNEIRKGWLSEAANRILGRTREGGIERLGETLTPILNEWGMPEWAYLRGERLCAFKRQAAAGAGGTFAGVALCNTTVGMLLVVESIAALAAAASDQLQLWIGLDADIQATYAANSLGVARDRRWPPTTAAPGSQVSQAVIRYGAGAVPTGQQLELQIQTSTSFNYFAAVPIILPPGHAVWVITGNDASVVDVNYVWRERKAYPGELV